MAPTVGEHNDAVMADVLGYDAEKIAQLKSAGAFGKA
jgi:crotonobetainyl-CoA:carnitine CoA-transferase CaiB-like acyl-CoA transferase